MSHNKAGAILNSGKFKFTYVPMKEMQFFQNQDNLDYLLKWSMKGNLKVKFYNFNEKFLPYLKQEFVESFFTDPNVYKTMEAMELDKWHFLNKSASKVTVKQVPCTVTSMDFFNRISDNEGKIAKKGRIIQCMEELIDGFYVNDHLRALLLDPAHEVYQIYSSSERKEFIFQLLMHFALGGMFCQEDFEVTNYLNLTKQLYKELMSVQRMENQTEIKIRSLILKVVAYDENDQPLCPTEPGNKQNFVYLIIDDFKRQVAVLMHQHGISDFNA